MVEVFIIIVKFINIFIFIFMIFIYATLIKIANENKNKLREIKQDDSKKELYQKIQQKLYSGRVNAFFGFSTGFIMSTLFYELINNSIEVTYITSFSLMAAIFLELLSVYLFHKLEILYRPRNGDMLFLFKQSKKVRNLVYMLFILIDFMMIWLFLVK
jgi:hypothetical protein